MLFYAAMIAHSNLAELRAALRPFLTLDPTLTLSDPAGFRERALDGLVYTAVFASEEPVRDAARWVVREAAAAQGAWSASIQDLYAARGRGECRGFTVPAINIRGLTYDTARAVFRAARGLEAGAVIFEIARSEIGYTFQRPAEYAAVVLGAALREAYTGPVFLQGDHFQFNAAKHTADPEAETRAVLDLTREAIAGGFLNIDIDASTLVDLSRPTVAEQQQVNAERAAEATALIRRLQPAGVTISVGGEIGEVGKQNSTPEELTAFMDGLARELERRGAPGPGPSKISVQTGTSHGGVPLPDGSVAKVKIDFTTLTELSRLARERYRMAGAVQHGASTLPEELFDRFPQTETAEIHLATGFQNLLFAHPALPRDLRDAIDAKLRVAHADERKPGETDEQFIYKTRKKGYGHFKRELWDIAPGARQEIGAALEARFALLFRLLGVAGSRALVARTVRRVDVPLARPSTL